MRVKSAHVATIVASVVGVVVVGSVVLLLLVWFVVSVVVSVGNVGEIVVAVAKREFVLLQTLDKPFHIG